MYCRSCGQQIHDEAVVCVHCGVPVGKGKEFCPNCGGNVHPEAVVCVRCGVELKKKIPDGIQKRSIVTAIILSLVTCGIYGIYWFIKLTDEMNAMTGNENDTSGGTAFLLSLVTCGIYTYYWAYKLGEKRDSLGEKGSSAVIYLVLMFVCGIAVYALAQDAINQAIEKK